MAEHTDTAIPDPTASAEAAPSAGGGYDASNITVLEGLEAVRKRPGMYIGSTGERGLHHLVYEVVDNSVDEALAGHADTIDVTLLADGGVRVVDNGRGIPVAIHPTEGRPTVEVVMTILHAGGKFGGGGYAVSGGLHGVGISVVNALSSRVVTEVQRDGYAWRQEFADGGKPVGELHRGEATEATGTTQTFWADPTIFETTEYDFETLRARFQQYAFLNKGLRITLTDERPAHLDTGDEVTGEAEDGTPASGDGTSSGASPAARTVSYKYDGGLIDYVKHLNGAKKVELVHPDVIDIESEDTERRISVEIAMQWTSAYSESVHTFANTISTTEGGTHEEGFRAAMTSLVNRYARDKGILKDKDENLTGDDIREGLTAVISVKLGEPQFEGQTKTKLGNTEAKTFVQRVVNERLNDWFDSRTRTRPATSCARRSRRRRRGSPPARRARPPAARACSSRAACRASCATASRTARRSARSSSSRVTPRAALPCAGATPDAGDPPDPREDPQRRARAPRPGPVQPGGPVDHHGVRHRHRRGLRPHQAPVPQDRPHGRRRRRRPAHRDAPAHAAVPVHAPAHRERARLSRAAAALPAQVVELPHDYVYSDKERDAFLAAGQVAGKRIPKENGSSATRVWARWTTRSCGTRPWTPSTARSTR